MTNITLDDLLNDLQKAKDIAERNKNPNASVAATLAQAKLLGLDKPQLHDKNQDAIDLMADFMKELSNEKDTYHS